MAKKSHTIAFRVTTDELSALREMGKPNQRMSDLIRELIRERNNENTNTAGAIAPAQQPPN